MSVKTACDVFAGQKRVRCRRRSIVASDVNAHAHAWDPHQPEDPLGRQIEDWSVDESLTILKDVLARAQRHGSC